VFRRSIEHEADITEDTDMIVTKLKTSKPRRKATPATPASALADLDLRHDALLSTAQAAAVVGLSPKTMRQMKCDHAGPRSYKLGTTKQARTVYRRSDLEAWIRSRVAAVQGS
jgi:predicted DNA-binding transcriptional regulator AlpA